MYISIESSKGYVPCLVEMVSFSYCSFTGVNSFLSSDNNVFVAFMGSVRGVRCSRLSPLFKTMFKFSTANHLFRYIFLQVLKRRSSRKTGTQGPIKKKR